MNNTHIFLRNNIKSVDININNTDIKTETLLNPFNIVTLYKGFIKYYYIGYMSNYRIRNNNYKITNYNRNPISI